MQCNISDEELIRISNTLDVSMDKLKQYINNLLNDLQPIAEELRRIGQQLYSYMNGQCYADRTLMKNGKAKANNIKVMMYVAPMLDKRLYINIIRNNC